LARQASPRHAAQFVVDDRDQSLPGRDVTRAPAREQIRDLVGRSGVQGSSLGTAGRQDSPWAQTLSRLAPKVNEFRPLERPRAGLLLRGRTTIPGSAEKMYPGVSQSASVFRTFK